MLAGQLRLQTHTHNICCFSTRTIVARTHLIVTLYVHCLQCYISFQCRQHHAVNSPLFIDWNPRVLEQQTIESFCSNRPRTGMGSLLYRLPSCAAGHSDTFLHTPADPSLDVHCASVNSRQRYIQCLLLHDISGVRCSITHSSNNSSEQFDTATRKFTASTANGNRLWIVRIMLSNWNDPPKKTHIYHAVVKSTITYAAETWCLKAKTIAKLNFTEIDFWRRSARISRKDKIRNTIIKQEMSV